MLGLVLILHLFIGATLAGSFVVLALVLGLATALPIAAAVLLGFVAAFPVSWIVAKALHGD